MNEEAKPISISWSTPELCGDCPHCGEWVDWQDQNMASGEGWDFQPCESVSSSELEKRKVTFVCPKCGKDVLVNEVSW